MLRASVRGKCCSKNKKVAIVVTQYKKIGVVRLQKVVLVFMWVSVGEVAQRTVRADSKNGKFICISGSVLFGYWHLLSSLSQSIEDSSFKREQRKAEPF